MALFEARNPAWLARVLAVGSVGFVAAAGLPAALGDVVRGHGIEAVELLAADVGLAAACAAAVRGDLLRRSRDSERFETELEVAALGLKRVDRFGNERTIKVSDLAGASARVALVFGTREDLMEDLCRAAVYARRLEASKLFIVPVPSDGGDVGEIAAAFGGAGFVLLPSAPRRFAEWFKALIGDAPAAYVTLDQNSRVRGSGKGRPRFDTLLSSMPRNRIGAGGIGEADDGAPAFQSGGTAAEGAPVAVAEDAFAEADQRTVVAASRRFYAALSAGDEAAMAAEWEGAEASLYISGAEKKGAQLDGWQTVLKPDRRPLGMTAGDYDVTIAADGATAYATLVETVENRATLLATQRFSRTGDGAWRLQEHRTIPWGKDVVGKVALRCDCRGCVALPAKTTASFAARPDNSDDTAKLLARD